jgi:MFS superfamily sulfate permease-like transporter
VLARVHAADARPGTIVLDFEAVGYVDVTGAEALRTVHDTLAALGTRVIIACAKSNVRSALRRDGVVDVLGEANFAPTVERALEAHAPACGERATLRGSWS